MSKPLFADSWYETPRVPELRQEIQNLYRGVANTISLKAHRISDYTFATADTWYDIPMEEVVEDESLGGVTLDDDGIIFTFEREGLVYVSGCIRPEWTGGATTAVVTASRIMNSEDGGVTWTENRCLQAVNGRSFRASEVGTQRFSGTVYATPGFKVKLQALVDDTDMLLSGWGGFDRPVSTSIELHGIGPATREDLLN
jgi:hypothetical protein